MASKTSKNKTKLNQDSFYLLSITRHNYLQIFSFFLIHPCSSYDSVLPVLCSSYHSALPVPQDSWGGIYFTSLKGVLEKNILVKGEPFPCILPTKVIRSLNPLSIERHFPLNSIKTKQTSCYHLVIDYSFFATALLVVKNFTQCIVVLFIPPQLLPGPMALFKLSFSWKQVYSSVCVCAWVPCM